MAREEGPALTITTYPGPYYDRLRKSKGYGTRFRDRMMEAFSVEVLRLRRELYGQQRRADSLLCLLERERYVNARLVEALELHLRNHPDAVE